MGGDLGGNLRESGSRLQDDVNQKRKQTGADGLGRMLGRMRRGSSSAASSVSSNIRCCCVK